MHFTAQTSSNGVVERSFILGEVTGVLWSPASGCEPAPLVLVGHGTPGSHHEVPWFEVDDSDRFFQWHLR